MFNLKKEDELKGDIHTWIVSSENMTEGMSKNYKMSREYYENQQEPANKPAGVDYLVRNLITDYVHRKMAKMLSNHIEPELYGDPQFEIAYKELIMEIYEQNKFFESLFEVTADRFNVEGLTGWKLRWNPFRLGVFGLGFPEIFVARWDNILLDFNASDGSHLDDHVRAWKRRILVDEAHERYPEFKSKIGPFGDQKAVGATGQTCLEYEVEFKKLHLWPHVPVHNENGQINGYIPVPMKYNDKDDTVEMPLRENNGLEKIETFMDNAGSYFDRQKIKGMDQLYGKIDRNEVIRIEVPIFYRAFVVNQTELVSTPEPTNFRGWTIIPVMNLRQESMDKLLPVSKLPYIKSIQDHINVTISIIHLLIKREAKNPIFIKKCGPKEIFEMKNISDVVPIIALDNPDADVWMPPGRGIPPHLKEYYELSRGEFDEVGGDMPTERGAIQGEFSGRAIAYLQATGDLADLIPLKHIESSLIELTNRILECIQNFMTKEPFEIYRMINGVKSTIRYNSYLREGEEFKPSEYEIIRKIKELPVINPLEMARFAKINVEMEMNVMQKEISNMQKMSLVAEDMARIDRLKMTFPKKYQTLMANKEKEDAAVELVTELAELGPEALTVAKRFVQMAKGNMSAATSMMQSMGGGNGGMEDAL